MRHFENILRHFENILRHIEKCIKILYIMEIAIGLGIAALIGGLMGTQMTNDANEEQAALSRKFQAEENEKSRQFQKEMTESQQDYNSAANQVSRLREAGINPFIQQSSVSAGEASLASSPALQSAPALARLLNPMDSGFSNALGVFQMANQTKLADANSANQRSQSLKTLVDSWKEIYKTTGSKSVADNFINQYAPFLTGADWEKSPDARNLNALSYMYESQAAVNDVQQKIENKFGFDKARQIVWNLQQQSVESVTKCGLWNTMAKVNESSVELNSSQMKVNAARIQEIAASAYKQWSEGSYVKALQLTEDEKRKLFVGSIALDFMNQRLDYNEHAAAYNEKSGVRKYQNTKAAQNSAVFDYGLNNNPASSTIGFLTKNLKAGLETSKSARQYRPHMNTKYTQYGKYNGNDFKREDYYYMDEW